MTTFTLIIIFLFFSVVLYRTLSALERIEEILLAFTTHIDEEIEMEEKNNGN